MSSSFTIVRLLPGLLGLNGSAANAEIVARSLRELGHTVRIIDVENPSEVDTTVDLVCVGSGSGSQLRPAATQLLALASNLQEWKRKGAWFCAVGSGWDLLGHHVTLAEGETIPGAGIFPSSADLTTARFFGEVCGVDHRGRPSAGYINQVGTATLDEGVEPLLHIQRGAQGRSRTDGLIAPGLMATRLGGPALALNPHWTDGIVSALLASRKQSFEPQDFHRRVASAATHARGKIEQRLATTT